MSEFHVVTKTPVVDPDTGAVIELESDLSCPGPEHCDGWDKCKHPVHDTDSDPEPAGEWGDLLIHGVVRRWLPQFGWGIKPGFCVIDAYFGWADYMDDELQQAPAGRYEVDIEWDEDPHLTMIGPASEAES